MGRVLGSKVSEEARAKMRAGQQAYREAERVQRERERANRPPHPRRVGCAHNEERVIEYRFTKLPDPKLEEERLFVGTSERFPQVGDGINFICPHGCAPVQILVRMRREERLRR